MSKETKEFKQEIALKWVKAESGNTYLCPSTSLSKIDSRDEHQLKTICVDESNNPQND